MHVCEQADGKRRVGSIQGLGEERGVDVQLNRNDGEVATKMALHQLDEGPESVLFGTLEREVARDDGKIYAGR